MMIPSTTGVRVGTKTVGIDAHMHNVLHRSNTGGLSISVDMVFNPVKQRAGAPPDDRVRRGHQDGRGAFFAFSAYTDSIPPHFVQRTQKTSGGSQGAVIHTEKERGTRRGGRGSCGVVIGVDVHNNAKIRRLYAGCKQKC